MRKAGQECPDKPTMPSLETRILRVKLIAEELDELAKAFNLDLCIIDGGIMVEEFSHGKPNLVKSVDGTGDLRVVVSGTDVAMGVDGQAVDEEIHRSNMTKFIDGHRREDGKWVKGPNYTPANLQLIIDAQLNLNPITNKEGLTECDKSFMETIQHISSRPADEQLQQMWNGWRLCWEKLNQSIEVPTNLQPMDKL